MLNLKDHVIITQGFPTWPAGLLVIIAQNSRIRYLPAINDHTTLSFSVMSLILLLDCNVSNLSKAEKSRTSIVLSLASDCVIGTDTKNLEFYYFSLYNESHNSIRSFSGNSTKDTPSSTMLKHLYGLTWPFTGSHINDVFLGSFGFPSVENFVKTPTC